MRANEAWTACRIATDCCAWRRCPPSQNRRKNRSPAFPGWLLNFAHLDGLWWGAPRRGNLKYVCTTSEPTRLPIFFTETCTVALYSVKYRNLAKAPEPSRSSSTSRSRCKAVAETYSFRMAVLIRICFSQSSASAFSLFLPQDPRAIPLRASPPIRARSHLIADAKSTRFSPDFTGRLRLWAHREGNSALTALDLAAKDSTIPCAAPIAPIPVAIPKGSVLRTVASLARCRRAVVWPSALPHRLRRPFYMPGEARRPM